MMPTQTIHGELTKSEVSDGIAVLTIDRPQVHNALNAQVLDEIRSFLTDVRDRDDVKAVIFTGSGEKAFIAGADISQLVDYTPRDGLMAKMQRLYDEIEEFEKPTIAAVNGYALGGGNELAMACDIRIASSNARFGLPETNLGVLPGAGGTQRLARLVGKGRAVELILTGRMFDAEEAFRIGLVARVVAPERLLEAAQETAAQILAKGPLAVRLGKIVIKNGFETDQRTGMLLERLAQALLYASPEKVEGTNAFLEKRLAAFDRVQ
ncbi:enoyl-CoA hydratase-related protein [Arthrobacter sp. NPDC080031]|uniref:enoyl-CoA hydratase/isomerase family protein n=1 Tax=Arthrobacter sp. NPDC080031 TaxID=3155918 RepID=UPI00344D569B